MECYAIEPGETYYVYKAAILCEECGIATREALAGEGKAPADPEDETSYDSDDYPKGPYKLGYDRQNEVEYSGDPGTEYETCDRMSGCLSLASYSEV